MKRASQNYNRRKMMTFWLSVFFLVLALHGRSVYALDPLGPPASEIQKWQLYTGFEYSQSSIDIELVKGSFKENINGTPVGSGSLIDIAVNGIESDKIGIYFGYGIARNCETFVRLGASSSEFGNSALGTMGKFDSDYTPSVGIGIKLTLYEEYRFDIGAVLQAGWSQYSGQINPSQFISPSNITMDFKEAQIALGALYRWTDSISVYGGPFYHYVTGELEDNFVYFDPETFDIVTADDTWDIESGSDFGGYFGTRVNLGRDFSINVEYQMTSDADALAAGIVWKY